ncbi:F-box/FBD/LRR-repeat protein At1g13570-like [Lycium ferocissimum]|uniref:F-box/FBD/LRR-repeat protein At1g13570-like n=1 Tax=Lycium ferocissimum TaxID=112874 RepID=UPI0028155C1D|nr:F-box/FBD/LRR-repeat protein At1g13570-like [Lycium ferocissimum]
MEKNFLFFVLLIVVGESCFMMLPNTKKHACQSAGPISKFILSLILEDFPEIDRLIYFLSKKDVQHLDLRLLVSNNQYNLPSSIFTCLQLRYLSLHGCSIQLAPPTFKGFDMLNSLELHSVTISSEILESLISSCPLLEQLLLRDIIYSGVIEINAPKLRSFDFVENIGSVCLKSVPRLAKFSLWHTKYHVGIGNCFKSFSSLEYLELNACCLKFVAAVTGEVPTRLPFDLNSVKHLCLKEINLEELDEDADYNGDSQALECLEVEAFSDVTFNHLRKVHLFRTVGSNPEMQLIKLLLAKPPMLKEMLIFPLNVDDDFNRIEFPIMINSFRRASPEVEVIYANYG